MKEGKQEEDGREVRKATEEDEEDEMKTDKMIDDGMSQFSHLHH